VSDCVFCGIAAGTEPATMVREWPDAVAFVPLNPVITGHTLVIPRLHVRDAVENQAITALTMARAVELAAEYSASNILTSIGKAATQSVFHLHIHLIPRFVDDQLMLPWGTTGNPHEPHRCKSMDRLEAELTKLRGSRLPLGAGDPREPIVYRPSSWSIGG
jgi:histidine triad (HIT) family protein